MAQKRELDNKLLYIFPGMSFAETILLRVGYVKNGFGGELLVKHELPPIYMKPESIEGKKSHRGVMAGITWQPVASFFVTANVGYGVSGSYHVIDTDGNYSVTNPIKGLEVGGHISFVFAKWGHLKGGLFGGASVLPLLGEEHPFVDVSFGVGMVYLLGGDSGDRLWN